jgi:hypothetical protein
MKMNLADKELFYLASALVIFFTFIAVLILVVFMPLNKAIEPLMNAASKVEKSTVEEINRVRDAKKRFLLWDSLALVPLYTGLLIATSFLLGAKNAPGARMAATFLIAVAVIAAASDWFENYLLYFESGDVVNSPFVVWAERFKWLAIFAATGIASLIFMRYDIWGIVFVLMAFASLVGTGLVAFSWLGSHNIEPNLKYISGAFGIQLLIFFVVGFLLLFERCRVNFLAAD